MNNQSQCPDRDQLLALLDETLADEQLPTVQEHVDSCTDCQQAIEEIEAQDGSLEQIAGSLRQMPSPDVALQSALDKLKSRAIDDEATIAASSEDLDIKTLDFLQPSQQPGSLGRLGQYEINEVVGRGGMGIVFKANDTKLGRTVAVKVLAPEIASNPTAVKRFLREAQAAAAVSHDHIVTIHAVEEDRPPYLVMEFVDGVSLQQKIDRQGQLRLKEILRIARQIAAGLAAAHGQGIIHRDIKPANVLLQNGIERVQITDFGLARAVDDVSITRTGEVAGTPQYMSPEQAQGHPVDHRTDLFSLGSVLYTLCTGRPPFRADGTVAVLRRICDDTARPIREVNPDVPEWLAEIVDRLLAKRPEDRFETAAEVADLLGRHLAHVQDPGSTPPPGALPAVKRRLNGQRRRLGRWLVPGLAMLVLLAALGITEATGVTNVASTVIRIATGEGTLVIESVDPSVQISLDGEELSITGAGILELTLRRGQYQVEASQDGELLKTELVTITRNGRRIVTVGMESSTIATEATTKSTDYTSIPGSLPGLFPSDAPAPATAPLGADDAKRCQRQWADYLGERVEWSNSLGMRFVLIPPGEFTMGSSEAEKDWADRVLRDGANEHLYLGMLAESQRTVWITKPRFVQAHPVTVGDFRAFVEATDYETYAELTGKGIGRGSWDQRRIEQDPTYKPFKTLIEDPKFTWRTPGHPQSDDYPVTMITWNEAVKFCEWLSNKEGRTYRLPTEAEWEYACRAGTTTGFCFGNYDQAERLNEYGWYKGNSEGSTHPVGLKKPNAWGLFDMHGHVWEYCSDRYDGEAHNPSGGQTPEIDPMGPDRGWEYVRRSGSWMSTSASCRSAHRNPSKPDYVKCVSGFRIVCEVPAKLGILRNGRQSAEENIDVNAGHEVPPTR